MPHALPIIAIVGRPNVGKSTLFNRYAGRRRALVDDQPGLTRDRIAEEIEVAGRRILVADTAGLEPDNGKGLSAAVQAQARAAVAEADAILLVVDGRAGRLPEDERIARELRRTAKPVALAVNKIDHPRVRDHVAEFHALGLEPLEGVSAAHGTNTWEILEALVERLPPAAAEPPAEPGGAIRTAIVGRPNVGKSSLVNRLVGHERVLVAPEPGTTRDAIDVRIERGDHSFVLVDTAGLRRAARRAERAERGGALMALRSLERADVAVLLVDASQGATEQDARVAGLAWDRQRPTVIAANKWDLVPSGARERDHALAAIRDRLAFLAGAPIVAVSARTGAGVERILPQVRALHAAARRRITTSELNRWLGEATERHQPALGTKGARRRPIRFFYGTQTGEAPPTFLLFCTDPSAVRPAYRRYLERSLRERLGLDGVPLRLRLRSRRDGDKS